MEGTIHVFDLLDQPPAELPTGVCPLFGGERFLQSLAVSAFRDSFGDDNAEFSTTKFDGESCGWADVMDELATRSLFDAGSARLVVISDADKFVKQHRDQLEQLASEPLESGTLLLLVSTWPANTRLYKQLEKSGLQIHCDAPLLKRERSKQRDDSRIMKWLIGRAKSKYEFKLPTSCAPVLIELTECNFGLMDQELAKLSLYADQAAEFTPARVREIVGGWPAQTMWAAVDAAVEGRAGHALDMLHQLFAGGEHPLAMFGQISWSLRRYAEVGELVARDSRLKRRINMNDSLKAAGFRPWGGELQSAGDRLKQLGRHRVSKIMDWIVETDMALKRTHSKEDRGRLMLELLFTRMAGEMGPVPK